MAKIYVGTPMYGGLCAGPFARSMMDLLRVGMAQGVEIETGFLSNESLVTRGRNTLVAAFLKSDATHLAFIDADIEFNPFDLLRMMQSGKEIIGGIYPKKEINWQRVRAAVAANVPIEQLKLHTGSFVINVDEAANTKSVKLNEPFEVQNIGTGFMLIRREVFAVLAPNVPVYVNDVLDLGGTIKAEPIGEYFATSIEPDTRRLLSEDYHFCALWRRHGGKIWAAPWPKLSHHGAYAFDGRLAT
jgi:hypothetical protein